MSLLDHLSTLHPHIASEPLADIPTDVLAEAHAQDHRGRNRVRTHRHGLDTGGPMPAYADGSNVTLLDGKGRVLESRPTSSARIY